MILVVVSAGDPDRAGEGLRAGLGLGLRGDPVRVALTGDAARFITSADPRIARALRTLAQLGRPAEVASAAEVAALTRAARVVEFWSDAPDVAPAGPMSRGPARTFRVGERVIEVWREPPHLRARQATGASSPVDTCALVAQIFETDVP